MSGLGIDFGSPASSISSGSRKQPLNHGQQKRPRSMQLTESLNQFNDINRRSVPSKPGNPRPMSAIDPKSAVHDGKSYSSGPMNRNSRLGAAVAAMGDRDWDSTSNATPSDMYSPTSSSPRTETSATSYAPSAAGSNGLKRTQTVRKQVSQPNLSRSSTMVKRNTTDAPSQQQRSSRGPPSPDDHARGMIRSKSSMSLASQYRTNQPTQASLSRSITSGSTSLGRTSEIPRSASRAAAVRGRGGSMRGGMASNRRTTLDVQQSQQEPNAGDIMMIDGKRMIADGFGGYVEVKESEPDAESPRGTKYESKPTSLESQQAQNRPSLAPAQIPKPRPRSYTMGQLPNPAALRVGSFYGPDGEERARIDEDGRLSQHDYHRNSISESSDGPAPSSHHSSNASGRSAGPRLQFMNSPGVSAQSTREGTSVASGKSNAHSSTASGDGKGQLHKSVSMRSAHGFRGLSAAERGEAMVSLDDLNRYASTGYEEGEYILPGRTRTMDDESILQSVRLDARRESAEDLDQQRPRGHMRQASAPAGLHKLDDETTVRRQNATQLDRHGTLISSASNPARRSKDLTRLLGNNSGKLSSSASSDAGSSLSSASALSKSSNASNSMSTIMPQAVLEQGKSGKSRVDVDLILESELVVEGGMLTGRLEVKVRKNSTKDGHLMLSQPKVRVVGFEELVNDDTRHIFYHYATVIDGCTKVGKNVSQPYVLHGSPNLSPEADNRQPLACFASQPDSEGYSVAKEGQHSIPFALELPVGKGAKGTYRGKHAVVRYIVIGSVKLKSENGSNRSIAHFYRHIDLYPYLNPAIVLAGSGKPVQARASKGLFLGGSGKVHLIASLHRSSWVAGQRLYVNLRIDNETSKRVKSLTMTLIRTVILYRARPEFDMALSAPDDPSETYIDPDACTTSTSRKKICEDVLEMGQKGAKGTVTARGWWTGVEAGAAVELSHNMKLPVDALTITRGRHVEVSYSLKISVGSSLSSDVSVELPVRIVNFVSLDPPPLKSSIKHVTPARMNGRNAVSDSEAPMIARVRSMEALKSPQRIGNEFAGANDGRYLNVHRHVDAMQMTNNRGNQQRNLLPEDPEAARAKKLQHQKSLDFINHAIRSATARRVGSVSSNEPSPAGLGIEVDEARTPLAEESSGASSISDDSSSYVSSSAASMSSASEAIHPSCKPYQHMNNNYPPIVSLSGVVGGPRPIYMPSHSISVDDADDDSDEEYNAGEQTLILNDDSVADIDMVIGSAQVDGGESSPEFSQNRGMEAFGGDLTIGGENEGDLSTSTITSNDDNLYNEQMEDEFDEEEERLTALRQRQNQDQDDGPTPLARSPPKFQSNIPVRPPLSRNVDSSMSSPSDGNMSDTLSGYASTASSTAMSTNSAKELAEAKREGKTVVRTRSDLEKRLGRSSTIIRGPSTASSRPVSPSKQNPIPAKSALKTKSSFTYATAEQPIKQQASRTAPLTMPAASVRAKVDPHKALTAHKNPRPSVPMKQQQQKRIQLASDSEMSSASSESSNSPATSASALTPREQMSELEDGLPFDADRTIHASDLGGLGLQLQPIVQSVGIEDGMPKSKSVSMAVRPTQPKKASVTSIPTSVSARNANQASGVVAPSVRDKIAMLESRKRALKEFTAGGGGLEVPNNESVGTPPASRNARSNATPKQDPDTPTRVQAAAKSFLERNNSVLSQTSSVATSVQPDYLRNMSSVQSFKAPLLREK